MLILFLCAFYDVFIFFCQQLFYSFPGCEIKTEKRINYNDVIFYGKEFCR